MTTEAQIGASDQVIRRQMPSDKRVGRRTKQPFSIVVEGLFTLHFVDQRSRR